MRKEIVIAILVGLSMGLIVVYGIRTAEQSLTNRPHLNPTPGLIADSTAVQSNHTLVVTSPEPDDIIASNEVTVIGTTTPLSMISIISDDSTDTTTADDSGAFTVSVQVSGGPNQITVTGYSPVGDHASTTFTVVNSSADLSATASAKSKVMAQ